jgi:hypothetical protein
MCDGCLGQAFAVGSGSMNSSGAMAVDPRFDGPSADDEKFEGDKSDRGNA